MIFMNCSLPVQRYPKGLWTLMKSSYLKWNNRKVCLSVPLGAIQALSKRSRSVNLAPLANSTAEICLRPSSLTDSSRNKVAWPQAIKIWVSSRKMVPGAPPVRVRRENGSAQRWQVCSRKEGYAPGQGANRKSTRLNSSHTVISYAVFCLKKKKKTNSASTPTRSRQQQIDVSSR